MQETGSTPRPAKKPVWAVQTTCPVPNEHDVLRVFMEGAKALNRSTAEIKAPSLEPVDMEWVGHCTTKTKSAIKEVGISPEKQYQGLLQDTSASTIFHLHGGAFIFGSPAASQVITAKLSCMTSARCVSVNYRLSPQHTFPAALLDVLLAYLTILYPPPSSIHEPVPHSSIIFTGDSAGGCLCLALLQVILHFQRTSTRTIRFHGRNVTIPAPAGVACLSTYGDQTLSLPSWMDNKKYDYFLDAAPYALPGYPSCDIWPASPPRANIYCNDFLLCHPWVSPTIAESWNGSPPMWLACGEERMADSSKVIAQRAAKQGVTVVWEQYEAMPHCFPLIPVLNELPQGKRCFRGWAEFMKICFEDPSELTTKGTFVAAKTAKETEVPCSEVIDLEFGEVTWRMKAAMLAVEASFSKWNHEAAKEQNGNAREAIPIASGI
ncbi:MAG: hypothetical protein MMC33_010314 [Icmadophila ericetorum]|nr:hypothetical protein [Icmadophila ericetorum]